MTAPPLADIALCIKGEIEDRITCIDKIFSDYQEITFAEDYSRYLHNGNKMSGEQIPADAAINDNEKYRVYDSDKCFIGVYEFRDEVLYPVKIFYRRQQVKGVIIFGIYSKDDFQLEIRKVQLH